MRENDQQLFRALGEVEKKVEKLEVVTGALCDVVHGPYHEEMRREEQRIIYKYPVPFDMEGGVIMPAGSKILCVQAQPIMHDVVNMFTHEQVYIPHIWVLVDPLNPNCISRVLKWRPTGLKFMMLKEERYVGTVQVAVEDGTTEVYHLFDRGES